jgi:hypothetical protein
MRASGSSLVSVLSPASPAVATGQRTRLISFFTSTIATEETSDTTADSPDQKKPGGIAGTGLFKTTFHDPTRQGLRTAALGAGAGFAEFFIPYAGQRATLIDQAVRVSGHSAWHVRYHITPDDPTDRPAAVEIVAVDLPQPAYLVAIADGDDPGLQKDVDDVIASLQVV